MNVFGSLSTVVGGISGFGAGLGASIALAQVSPPMAAEAAPSSLANWSWDYCRCRRWLGTGIAEGWKNGW
ncbi:hypothetical protein LGW20_08325 [Streptococcus mutans]|uniref:hypothetical protein n=1 Tax=Streptococcus mutans TaxID=1309 RepID=UPI00159D692B|nr:hypothetical protein [Streptococcus mutans]MCB4945770.1 hypothetical protein [Streptococcus mutans]MCB4958799.1 hypothetical protein [Streptococcus mutans]MCB4966642.1 hypothetical protein [Streptococcus mutans]MCB4968185.1 hypothetical protein [Streptococcus mutans]MCB4970171.1 hypothetical protein [Streptococcus mutans]